MDGPVSATYKQYRRGAHRSVSPTETLARISRHLPGMGITRVANVTGLDRIGIPVVTVCRPNARSLAMTQGKGATLECAKVSGIMEAIEIHHAERLFLPGMVLSLEDISRKFNTVPFEGLPLRKDSGLTASTRLTWVQARDLITDSEIWVPHVLVNTDYTVPASSDHEFFITDTTGLASGNTLTEAINHAICEIVERDALALWWHGAATDHEARRIRPETVTSEYPRSLIAKLEAADMIYGIWDITSDLGVPTFICKIIDADEYRAVRPAYGSGTHPDKNVALTRALTEAAQSRITFISGARDDQFRHLYKKHLSSSMSARWREELTRHPPCRDFSDCVSIEHDFCEDDYGYLLSSLRKVGLNTVICADLTRDEYGIPVVRVLIPGLEGISQPEFRSFGPRVQKVLAHA